MKLTWESILLFEKLNRMTERELDAYMQEKKAYYTSEESMRTLESNVEQLLHAGKLTLSETIIACWTLELLCFTIHTPRGRDLYLQLVKLLSSNNDKMSKKYWEIYDDQENLRKRYNI